MKKKELLERIIGHFKSIMCSSLLLTVKPFVPPVLPYVSPVLHYIPPVLPYILPCILPQVPAVLPDMPNEANCFSLSSELVKAPTTFSTVTSSSSFA